MAAFNPVTVDCPLCGVLVDVPLTAMFGEAGGISVPVTLTPGLTPITAHAAKHQES